jgi:pimeloyl-ACP methyl ester carboxylesterase
LSFTLWGRFVFFQVYYADERQVAIILIQVEPVAEHEFVGDCKTAVMDGHHGFAPLGFVQERAYLEAGRLAGLQDLISGALWELDAVTRNSGCTLEDCFFSTEDELRLHGWWCRPTHAEGITADMVLLWFHGNAGNLSHRSDLMLRLAKTPAQVFIVDYRGYGRSEGRPSERRTATRRRVALPQLRAADAPGGSCCSRTLGAAVAIVFTRLRPQAHRPVRLHFGRTCCGALPVRAGR